MHCGAKTGSRVCARVPVYTSTWRIVRARVCAHVHVVHCVRAYAHVCVHPCDALRVPPCVCTPVYTSAWCVVCAHVRVHTCIYPRGAFVCARACAHVCMHPHGCMHVCVHVHTGALCVHVRACAHICPHWRVVSACAYVCAHVHVVRCVCFAHVGTLLNSRSWTLDTHLLEGPELQSEHPWRVAGGGQRVLTKRGPLFFCLPAQIQVLASPLCLSPGRPGPLTGQQGHSLTNQMAFPGAKQQTRLSEAAGTACLPGEEGKQEAAGGHTRDSWRPPG